MTAAWELPHDEWVEVVKADYIRYRAAAEADPSDGILAVFARDNARALRHEVIDPEQVWDRRTVVS